MMACVLMNTPLRNSCRAWEVNGRLYMARVIMSTHTHTATLIDKNVCYPGTWRQRSTRTESTMGGKRISGPWGRRWWFVWRGSTRGKRRRACRCHDKKFFSELAQYNKIVYFAVCMTSVFGSRCFSAIGVALSQLFDRSVWS